MLKEITEKEFNEVKGFALVDFNATWCGPCKMLHPVLDSLSEELTDVQFLGVDVDDNPDLAEKFGVTSIPCVVLVKDGKEVARSVGFRPAQSLKAFILAYKD